MNDTPNFAAWDTNTLADFAADAYTKLQQQSEAIDQLRLDLKYAMQRLREVTINKDDWK